MVELERINEKLISVWVKVANDREHEREEIKIDSWEPIKFKD